MERSKRQCPFPLNTALQTLFRISRTFYSIEESDKLRFSDFNEPLSVLILECGFIFISHNRHIQIGCQYIVPQHPLSGSRELDAVREFGQERKGAFFRYAGQDLGPVFTEAQKPCVVVVSAVNVF